MRVAALLMFSFSAFSCSSSPNSNGVDKTKGEMPNTYVPGGENPKSVRDTFGLLETEGKMLRKPLAGEK